MNEATKKLMIIEYLENIFFRYSDGGNIIEEEELKLLEPEIKKVQMLDDNNVKNIIIMTSDILVRKSKKNKSIKDKLSIDLTNINTYNLSRLIFTKQEML